MDEKNVSIFKEVFSAFDMLFDSEDTDGLQILGAILAMPDEQFEIVKPVLLESLEKSLNDPEAHLSLAQMMNIKGVKAEDFTASVDVLNDAIEELAPEGVEVSDSKKDLIRYVFSAFSNAMSNSVMVAHRIIQIPIELCRENAKLPTYATDGSAAMDIYSPEEYTIAPGESIMIPIGIKVNIPVGYALLIQPRSGLSRKTKMRIPNTPGLIDSDYHEEIGVLVENIDAPVKEVGMEFVNGELQDSTLFGSSFTIGKGERFAQMRLVEVPMVNWLPVKSLGSFENDHGEGFGSTGST